MAHRHTVEPPRAWPLGCRSVLGLVRHTTLKDLSASSMASCSHHRWAHISPTYNERIARSPHARGHRAATWQAIGAGHRARREKATRADDAALVAIHLRGFCEYGLW